MQVHRNGGLGRKFFLFVSFQCAAHEVAEAAVVAALDGKFVAVGVVDLLNAAGRGAKHPQRQVRLFCRLLAQQGIEDLAYEDLTDQERQQADDYFRSLVLPILSPQIVSQRHPTPHLGNKEQYVVALLRSKSGKASLGFVPLPRSLRPLFLLPGSQGRYLRLETILRHWTPTLFSKYQVEETTVICATRNADLSFDGEKFEDSDADFRQLMTRMLKKRANQSIVRLELGYRPSKQLLDLLEAIVQVKTHQIYYDSAPLVMGYVYDLEKALPDQLRQALTYPPYQPRWPEDLVRGKSMIDQIRQKDRLPCGDPRAL